MTDQLALVPQEAPKLTDRQQAALDYIAAHDGVPADEIGAHWHSLRGKHPVGARCDWCEADGKSVVKSKALREMITFKRDPGGRLYVLRGAAGSAGPARHASDQIAGELPGTTWEDAFGGAA